MKFRRKKEKKKSVKFRRHLVNQVSARIAMKIAKILRFFVKHCEKKSLKSEKIVFSGTDGHFDSRKMGSSIRFGENMKFYEKSMRKSKVFDGSEPRLALYSSPLG